MRASISCLLTSTPTVSLTSTILFVAVSVSASTARAVPLPAPCTAPTECGAGQGCVVSERLGLGVCIPMRCGTGDAGALRSGCFGPGDTIAEEFASGDCDGDLVPNEAESDASVCGGAAVIALDPSAGFRWVEPARLDVGTAMIAPRDATSSVSYALGIGCSRSRPCPALPTGPELASRCIYVTHDGEAGDIGVCTYYVDDRDDDSCLIDDYDVAACLAMEPGEPPHVLWEHGDCDGDGLINKLDTDVCRTIELMGQVSGGFVECAHGSLDGTACTSELAEIASDRYGCAVDSVGAFVPFAFCCRSHEDCPYPTELDSPSRGRCVFLGTDPEMLSIGACTYDAADLGDDGTCVGADPPLAPACLSGELSYTAWANGNCDPCDPHPNYSDEIVCGGCDPGDAGTNLRVDASTPTDAGGGLSEDGAIPSLDANAPDAATSTPGSFAGSGCRCGIASRAAAPPLFAWLVLLLVAPPLLGRRKL